MDYPYKVVVQSKDDVQREYNFRALLFAEYFSNQALELEQVRSVAILTPSDS